MGKAKKELTAERKEADEELKKKIVEIVLNVEWTGCLGNTYHISGGMSAASAIADALIAAGVAFGR